MEAPIVEALLKSHVGGVAIFDQQLRCVQVNAEMARLASIPRERLLGRTLGEILDGRRPDEHAAVANVLATGTPVVERTVEGPHLQLRVDYLPLRGESGGPPSVIVFAIDLSAQRRAEQALAQRLAVAELISEVSASFIDLDPSEIDGGIERAIRVIGERLGIDGTHIGVFSDDKSLLKLTHQWVRDGFNPTLADFQAFPTASLPWSSARVLAGEAVAVSSLAELPAEAQAERLLYEALGTEAVVVMPLSVGRSVNGMVAFAQAGRARHWTPDVLSSLRLTAEILANALDRKRNDVALRERLAFEEALSQLATRFMSASVDAIDGAIENALQAIGEALRYERTAVFLLDDPPEHMALHYEWCAAGVRSFKASMSGLSIREFGWPLDQIASGNVINIDRRTLPPEAVAARRVLDRDGFETLATVPMCIEAQVIGCVGFHARKARELPAPLIARLRLVGDIIAAALARKRSELARRRAFYELEQLKNHAERERDYLREEAGGHDNIVGGSAVLRRLLDTIDVVAATGATVLIRGESGVGKELIARAIHERSARRDAALVKVNCASVPKELFESEFFGHVRGAFTGAFKDRAGRFELADGGTLFLDEVGDIPLDLQAKLLRVLQESEFERVGDDRTRKVDVRIVAATNRNLEADVLAGRFRQDLYYRLSVFPLEVPPLRARRDDIVPLAEHFVRSSAKKLGRSDLGFDDAQRAMLLAYDWPGNVRELQHVIERAVILSPAPPLQLERALQVGAPAAVPMAPPAGATSDPPQPILKESDLRALEHASIVAALDRSAGRIAGPGGAAELLGTRPSTLRDRMKALGIKRSS